MGSLSYGYIVDNQGKVTPLLKPEDVPYVLWTQDAPFTEDINKSYVKPHLNQLTGEWMSAREFLESTGLYVADKRGVPVPYIL